MMKWAAMIPAAMNNISPIIANIGANLRFKWGSSCVQFVLMIVMIAESAVQLDSASLHTR